MPPSAWEFCYDSLGGQFTAPWGLCPVGKTEPQSLQTQSSGCPGQVSTGHQAQPPTHRGFLEEVRDEAEPRHRLPQSSFHLVSVFTSLLPHPILNLPLPRLGLCRSFHCRVIPLCPPLTPYPTSWHHPSEASGGWDLGEASLSPAHCSPLMPSCVAVISTFLSLQLEAPCMSPSTHGPQSVPVHGTLKLLGTVGQTPRSGTPFCDCRIRGHPRAPMWHCQP